MTDNKTILRNLVNTKVWAGTGKSGSEIPKGSRGFPIRSESVYILVPKFYQPIRRIRVERERRSTPFSFHPD